MGRNNSFLYRAGKFLSIGFCAEVGGLAQNEGWVEGGVFKGIDHVQGVGGSKEEGGCQDIGEGGVFGDDPRGEEVFGRGGGVGVDDVMVVAPAAAVGAGGAEGASCHFEGADDFCGVARVFEPYAYGFAVSFVDDVAASIDQKPPRAVLAEEVSDAVAEIALADRAEVEKDGVFDGDMRVVEKGHGFQKIGREPDYLLRREGIVGIVTDVGEGMAYEWRDFSIGCLVESDIVAKHGGEIAWHGDVASLSLCGYVRDEGCWDEAREYGFELRRPREDFADKRMKTGRWHIVPNGYFPMRPEGVVGMFVGERHGV